MGLDMYLYKKTYVKHWEHNGDNNYKVEVSKAGKPVNIDPKKVTYIVEEAGYWRKANQIHNWFVENVQNGKDECQESYVSREQLEELLWVCRIVKIDKEKAEQLLPTQSGFFFGGTEYDEYYYQDIDSTIEILEEALSDESADDFAYRASW
jgi:hypothetical protein